MSGMYKSLGTKKSQTEDDDIDYNITFPSVNSGENEPVIFLLGWTAAKDKTLAKYSLIYENDGCITIRYIHPTTSIFTQDPASSKQHRETAEKLHQLLDDYDLKSHPVLIHSFSNGGYFVYRYLADVFHNNDVHVMGAVFDSGPSKTEFLIGARVIMTRGVFGNFFTATLCVIAFAFFCVYLKLKSFLPFFRTEPVYEYMQRSAYHTWPHLFLYSSADVIVPRHHVTDMMAARRDSGAVIVAGHDFATSGHVLHYRAHPELYTSQCLRFLHECLRVYDGERVVSETESQTSAHADHSAPKVC